MLTSLSKRVGMFSFSLWYVHLLILFSIYGKRAYLTWIYSKHTALACVSSFLAWVYSRRAYLALAYGKCAYLTRRIYIPSKRIYLTCSQSMVSTLT